ncbi:MAG: phospho-N-acetylmuramoyl-pentapeptide-transferase [Acidobacteriota bacterium]|jgi:phospho-N-acetylmuramoyl-pentapeptide-transferase|nr:phospho-N-acetylmuramoyl-pentapeptide-transferase [Acidobacteriota bacterium]
MVHWLFQWMGSQSGQRLFGYISFRALLAMLTAFILGVFLGRHLINIIFQLRFRDRIRNYGDISSRDKEGTPTMGGLIIFLAFLLALLMWCRLDNVFVGIIVFASFWFVSLGFLDDYLKHMRGNSDAGLSRTTKLFFQTVFGLILALLVLSPESTPFPADIVRSLFVPFLKNPVLDMGVFYYLFVILTVIAISNSINFADGLDGLATVPVALLAVVYGIFAYIIGNAVIADYLLYPYIPGTGELVVAMAALVGGLAAFLWFNAYPAQIFMGDTGAMFLGGVIATTAVLLKKELLFIIAGGVFVMEFLSVFIQDYVGIKWLKRRVFYRAPIHHSFQFLGIAEPKIVIRFWIVSILFALVSLISIKLR